MRDEEIISLYFERNEQAIKATMDTYSGYCRKIAWNILENEADVEEVLSDTWLRTWNTIPPQRPQHLRLFLGKITRNLALNRYRYYMREKRGCGQIPLVLDELQECVPAANSTEEMIEEKLLVELLNRFLHELPLEKRMMFLRRYWYMSSIQEIANDYEISEGKVKMTLLRIRNKLKQILEKEGIVL